MNVWEKVKEVEDYIIKCRRDLHQIPEVGLNLPKTSAYVANELKKMGIEVKEKVAVSGVVGLIKGNNEGKTIALRAIMDTLPVKETNHFASKNGTCMPVPMMPILQFFRGMGIKIIGTNKRMLS